MTVDYSQLYRFREDFSLRGKRFRANPDETAIDDPAALVRGEERPKQAIRFEHQMGKSVCDVIWTGYVGCLLISKNFQDILKQETFTGWSTFPVKVIDPEGEQLRGYAGLVVTGRAGPVDNGRSQKFIHEPLVEGGPCFAKYRGMYFHDDKWDGSDFCMPDGRSSIIVTQRVKDALKGLLIPNVAFRQLSTDERDIS